MLSVSLTFADPRMWAFTRAIEKFKRVSKRDSRRIINKAAVKFIHAGAKRAKPGMKRRDVIPNPMREKLTVNGKPYRLGADDNSFGKKWAIVVRHQRKPSTLLETSSKQDPRRIIRNRGLAKQSFRWLAAKLGPTPGGGAKPTGSGYRGRDYSSQVSVTRKSNVQEESVRLIDMLGYVQRAYPGIVGASLRSATRSLLGELKTTGGKWVSIWDR